MNTANIRITKVTGEITGRVREVVTVSINEGQEFEVPYGAGWGFTVGEDRFRFRTNTRGGLEVVSPRGGKAISLGARGGRIDLDSWNKIK